MDAQSASAGMEKKLEYKKKLRKPENIVPGRIVRCSDLKKCRSSFSTWTFTESFLFSWINIEYGAITFDLVTYARAVLGSSIAPGLTLAWLFRQEKIVNFMTYL